MSSTASLTKPVRAVGSFYAMAGETLLMLFRPPFAWREFLLQSWFVARARVVVRDHRSEARGASARRNLTGDGVTDLRVGAP